MSSLAMIGWTLIVIIRGTTPPVGVTVEGFTTKQACEVELEHYCDEKLYRCACRPSFKEDP